jgi:hypothetical protein
MQHAAVVVECAAEAAEVGRVGGVGLKTDLDQATDAVVHVDAAALERGQDVADGDAIELADVVVAPLDQALQVPSAIAHMRAP